MISWFSEQVPAASKSTGTKMTSDNLRRAIEETKQKCRDLEAQVVDKTLLMKIKNQEYKEGASAAASADTGAAPEGDEEEEEEDEDVDDDFDEEAVRKAEEEARRIQGAKGQRTSVSAEAYGAWNKKEDFVPPMNPKSPDEVKAITAILEQIFMFSHLDKKALSTVVGATALHDTKAG